MNRQINLQEILKVLNSNGGKELSIGVVLKLLKINAQEKGIVDVYRTIKKFHQEGHYKISFHDKTDKKGVTRHRWMFLSLE